MSRPSATVARWLLGALLGFAGLAHLFWARTTFRAQVPDVLPIDADLVVVVSGLVEIVLAVGLLAPWDHRAATGWVVAAFFVAVFGGNIAQYVDGVDAFGLDTDRARLVRLFVQPVLVVWALWCTGAWVPWRPRETQAPT